MPWLKRHLAGSGVPASVVKLSGGNSSQFKDEAMELFRTRYVMLELWELEDTARYVGLLIFPVEGF